MKPLLLFAIATLPTALAAPAVAQGPAGPGAQTSPEASFDPEVDQANMHHSHGLETAVEAQDSDVPPQHN